MNIEINSVNELEVLNNKLKEMLDAVDKLSVSVDSIKFLTVKDMAEITGWNIVTARNVFNRPDFPSCDFGKEKIVEVHALVDYFSLPRRRGMSA